MISPSQKPLPDNTQHSQQTNIHAPGGIRTQNLSRRAAKDLRLSPRAHWDRLLLLLLLLPPSPPPLLPLILGLLHSSEDTNCPVISPDPRPQFTYHNAIFYPLIIFRFKISTFNQQLALRYITLHNITLHYNACEPLRSVPLICHFTCTSI